MKRAAVWLILILAFCGIADSAYIAESISTGTPLICNIGNLDGCNIVAQSPYSVLFGIPLADYGLLFYGILFLLAAIEIAVVSKLIRRLIQAVAILGFIASVVFVYIQVELIGAICIYCMASATITLLVFLLSLTLESWKRIRRNEDRLPITISINQ